MGSSYSNGSQTLAAIAIREIRGNRSPLLIGNTQSKSIFLCKISHPLNVSSIKKTQDIMKQATWAWPLGFNLSLPI